MRMHRSIASIVTMWCRATLVSMGLNNHSSGSSDIGAPGMSMACE